MVYSVPEPWLQGYTVENGFEGAQGAPHAWDVGAAWYPWAEQADVVQALHLDVTWGALPLQVRHSALHICVRLLLRCWFGQHTRGLDWASWVIVGGCAAQVYPALGSSLCVWLLQELAKQGVYSAGTAHTWSVCATQSATFATSHGAGMGAAPPEKEWTREVLQLQLPGSSNAGDTMEDVGSVNELQLRAGSFARQLQGLARSLLAVVGVRDVGHFATRLNVQGTQSAAV